MEDFEKVWEPHKKKKSQKSEDDLDDLFPTLPMPMAQPMVSISICPPAPAPMDPMLMDAIEDECEESDEYTSDMDDYSKPNPMRALKALLGKG